MSRERKHARRFQGMKRLTHRNIEPGDVFAFLVTDDLFAVGVVVRSDIELYICVFKEMVSSGNLPGLKVEELTLFLVGRTSDEKFFHGEWKLIDRLGCIPDVPFPAYVVETPEGLFLKDFDGKSIRLASQAERDFFGGARSVSNVAFEKAMKSSNGIDYLDYDYSRILVSEAERRVVPRA